jgi:hypothetical protein
LVPCPSPGLHSGFWISRSCVPAPEPAPWVLCTWTCTRTCARTKRALRVLRSPGRPHGPKREAPPVSTTPHCCPLPQPLFAANRIAAPCFGSCSNPFLWGASVLFLFAFLSFPRALFCFLLFFVANCNFRFCFLFFCLYRGPDMCPQEEPGHHKSRPPIRHDANAILSSLSCTGGDSPNVATLYVATALVPVLSKAVALGGCLASQATLWFLFADLRNRD